MLVGFLTLDWLHHQYCTSVTISDFNYRKGLSWYIRIRCHIFGYIATGQTIVYTYPILFVTCPVNTSLQCQLYIHHFRGFLSWLAVSLLQVILALPTFSTASNQAYVLNQFFGYA
jgi:uncharacterized membrane protein YcfT